MDQNGSVVAVTDANQNIQIAYTNDAFGRQISPIAGANPTVPNDLQFQSNWLTVQIGTAWYMLSPSRVYDPTLGRFLQRDPLPDLIKVEISSNGNAGGIYVSTIFQSLILRRVIMQIIFGRGISDEQLNRYIFGNSNPISGTDATGMWFGLDDLIASVAGAALGLIGQGIGDLISGKVSGWEDYTASALGGAAAGEVLLYAGPLAAGATFGLVSNLTKQGLKNLSGNQCGFDVKSLAFDTAIGTATGFIPGARIPGLTSGRNSLVAISKQILTKADNGTISSVTAKTAAKTLGGQMLRDAQVESTVVGAASTAIGSRLGIAPDSGQSCPCP
jgi:hypothetical protein